MEKHKFTKLDGLRGLAALAVVFQHFINAFLPSVTGVGTIIHCHYENWLHVFPISVFWNGNFAVCLFFVLSGFVLSVKYFQVGSYEIIANSALKRYFRLMLPALGSVLIAYILLKAGFMFNREASGITGSTDWLAAFWNFPASINNALYEGTFGAFIKGTYTYNTNLWTMQLELAGSFLVFATMAFFGKVRQRWLVYIFLIVIFWGTYYVAFLIGLLLSDSWINRPKLWHSLPKKMPLVLAMLLLALILGGWPNDVMPHTMYYKVQMLRLEEFVRAPMNVLTHTVGAALIMIVVLGTKIFDVILDSRLVLFLGRNSFALYLLHLVVIGSFSSYMMIHLVNRLGYNVSMVITTTVSLIVIFIASSIYTKYIDIGAIKLSSAFSKWAQGNTTDK